MYQDYDRESKASAVNNVSARHAPALQMAALYVLGSRCAQRMVSFARKFEKRHRPT